MCRRASSGSADSAQDPARPQSNNGARLQALVSELRRAIATSPYASQNGHTRNGKEMERRGGFDPITEAAGAVAIYPDAIHATWNDGWWDTGSDDLGFLAGGSHPEFLGFLTRPLN